MSRHDYILLFSYTVRRISLVGGVQVVGIPSTHWLMGEDGRMAEGTLYTADNTFLSIVKTILNRRRRCQHARELLAVADLPMGCGCDAFYSKRKFGRHGVVYDVCYWWFCGYPCIMRTNLHINLYLYGYVHVERCMCISPTMFILLYFTPHAQKL